MKWLAHPCLRFPLPTLCCTVQYSNCFWHWAQSRNKVAILVYIVQLCLDHDFICNVIYIALGVKVPCKIIIIQIWKSDQYYLADEKTETDNSELMPCHLVTLPLKLNLTHIFHFYCTISQKASKGLLVSAKFPFCCDSAYDHWNPAEFMVKRCIMVLPFLLK